VGSRRRLMGQGSKTSARTAVTVEDHQFLLAVTSRKYFKFYCEAFLDDHKLLSSYAGERESIFRLGIVRIYRMSLGCRDGIRV
jgi:hypothetical protein